MVPILYGRVGIKDLAMMMGHTLYIYALEISYRYILEI